MEQLGFPTGVAYSYLLVATLGWLTPAHFAQKESMTAHQPLELWDGVERVATRQKVTRKTELVEQLGFPTGVTYSYPLVATLGWLTPAHFARKENMSSKATLELRDGVERVATRQTVTQKGAELNTHPFLRERHKPIRSLRVRLTLTPAHFARKESMSSKAPLELRDGVDRVATRQTVTRKARGPSNVLWFSTGVAYSYPLVATLGWLTPAHFARKESMTMSQPIITRRIEWRERPNADGSHGRPMSNPAGHSHAHSEHSAPTTTAPSALGVIR